MNSKYHSTSIKYIFDASQCRGSVCVEVGDDFLDVDVFKSYICQRLEELAAVICERSCAGAKIEIDMSVGVRTLRKVENNGL